MTLSPRQTARLMLKDQKPSAGIYAFRHLPGGAVWVGASKTLPSAEARLRFTLRTGGIAPADLTALWRVQPPDSFAFEVLEQFDPDLPAISLPDALKSRAAHWRQTLGARPI